METDNQIRDFIQNSYPEVSDNGKFIAELQEKLAILDQARTVYRREQRDIRRRIVAAFVVGILFGVAAILSFLFSPKVSLEPVSRIIELVIRIVYQGRFFFIASVISIIGLAFSFYRYPSKKSPEFKH